MLIDFYSVAEQALEAFKGGDGVFYARIVDTPAARFIKGRLLPGASIGYHVHETDSESIFVESGEGNVLYEGEAIPLPCGSAHLCPKGHGHSLRNLSDQPLTFFAVVTKSV